MFNNNLDRLITYVESQDFTGYDPYDTLLSWIPFHWLGKYGPVLAIQFQKRNPFNIRPLLGIKKDYNPKAMGLFLHAYSMLWSKTKKAEYKQKADFCFQWLENNYTAGYSGMGWGYNFPWASTLKYLKPYTPSAVVTGFVCRGIMEYYNCNPDPGIKKIISGAASFTRHDLEQTKDETGICISYTPVKKDICFNASLLGAEVLALNYQLNNADEDGQTAIQAVNYVISRQKQSGLWAYSIDEKGKERIQTDFHQGYVVESIFRIMKIFDQQPPGEYWHVERSKWVEAIKLGAKYYFDAQFHASGRSYWRLPKKWPVDIHNQAQGIITFQILKELCPEYRDFPETITKWTIENMQHPIRGYFYYQKFKTHTHKIPYIRWSQAWMMLALATHTGNE
jgi:hypothetical protein